MYPQNAASVLFTPHLGGLTILHQLEESDSSSRVRGRDPEQQRVRLASRLSGVGYDQQDDCHCGC